ncbi:SDR family NAD(P)-dependent oxidoreductase [Amycolatopsis pithecellobii]|uniref:SDR family NAD(P)-dependent oxidoreductase n=1 Tax=Amycolatopsis pithecellobii TaxID=664692 RepID=A0A6N7YLN6_9PSEU|nr:SDR family NAD(P)-dependent oxidoreductase [Amycolatopsis pithecellobii]MTD52942.1 SDR family NAD(P)-dependent oxidoreductase [Amycolatopsis pithecellobii]
MPTALVTGANRGLGFETARQLAAAGFDVYVAARDASKAASAAEKLGAWPLTLDVTDDDSVAAAAALVGREQGRLDVLVNNAAIRPELKPVAEVTAAEARRVFDTNVTGVIRVMHAFLPLLEKSGHGVVVNVGSGTGSFGRVHDPARKESKLVELPYITSKAALSMLTVQYAKAHPALRINIVDPGPTATGMNSLPGVQPVEAGAAPIVRAARFTPADPTGSFLDAAGVSPW